jgi:hypothetical protein
LVLDGYETWALTFRKERRPRVFEKRVERRIFGCKKAEGTGGLRKLHGQELHNVHSSTDIIRVMKSRKVIWVVHVACTGRRGTYRGFWWNNTKERNRFEDLGVGWKLKLKWDSPK